MLNDFKPVLYLLGFVWCTLSALMILPALVDLSAGHDDWVVFAASSMVGLYFGMVLVLANRAEIRSLQLRQAFWFTLLSWLSAATVGALPMVFGAQIGSYTDAFFEAVSALTTTGSTVMVGLDSAPPGLLLWRALLQWYGGIGIIATAIALLPLMSVGGMQLFHLESSDRSEKVMPRATQLAYATFMIYVGITAISAIGLGLAGMNPFDAVTHAMTAIATGGFSNYDSSIGHFDNIAIEMVLTATMFAGGTSFVLFLQVIQGRPMALWRDEQVRLYLLIIVAATLLLTAWMTLTAGQNFHYMLRHCLFTVVSLITTTGYATIDYAPWGPLPTVIFFALTFLGGCTGSTAGGLKMFRIAVLFRVTYWNMHRTVFPHGVSVPHFGGRAIPADVVISVLAFVTLWMAAWAGISIGLAATGLDFITATSGAATALANVGPGLGTLIGPSGNFATLPDAAKWLLAAGMLLGRLELTTMLIFLHPSFWRR
jgi:trk system potassium uptake protein